MLINIYVVKFITKTKTVKNYFVAGNKIKVNKIKYKKRITIFMY